MTWRVVRPGLHRDPERDLQAERCDVVGGVEWVVTGQGGTNWITTKPTLREAKAASDKQGQPEVTDSRWFDVLRTRQTRRAIPVRHTPTDWATAVADYRRQADMGHDMLMYETNETGTQRIRQVTDSEITDNQPKDVEA